MEGLCALFGPVQAGGLELDAEVPAAVHHVGGVHLQERGTATLALGLGRLLRFRRLGLAAGGGGVAGEGGVDLIFLFIFLKNMLWCVNPLLFLKVCKTPPRRSVSRLLTPVGAVRF